MMRIARGALFSRSARYLLVPSNAKWPIKDTKGGFAKRFEKIKINLLALNEKQSAA